MEKGLVMQTGVDRLLELLKNEGTLSLKEASVKLGVSSSAVLEWSKLLEEEGMLRIRYKFTTAYLESKNLQSKEYKNQKKELNTEKEVMDEQLESTNQFLVALEREVFTLRKMFNDLSGNFESSSSKLSKQIKQLEKYQSQKEKTDKRIIASKSNYLDKLHKLNIKLSSEEDAVKKWYGLLYGQVSKGGELLSLEQNDLRAIKKNEKLIEEKLADIQALLDKKVLSKIASDEKETSKLENTLRKIEKRYLDLKEEFASEKHMLTSLIDQNGKNVTKLEKMQQELIAKMQDSASTFDFTLEEVKQIPKKMDAFFKKKSLVEEILNRLHYNEKQFKKRLNELTARSQRLGKEISLDHFKMDLRDLEKEVRSMQETRVSFTQELKKLVSALKK